jgi:hypothetical protein
LLFFLFFLFVLPPLQLIMDTTTTTTTNDAAVTPLEESQYRNICKEFEFLSVASLGPEEDSATADAREAAESETRIQEVAKTPVDYKAGFARLDDILLKTTKSFFASSQAAIDQERIVTAERPKDEDGWKAQCYKVINPMQVELLRKNDFCVGEQMNSSSSSGSNVTRTYEDFWNCREHTEKAFFRNFLNIKWVDPHIDKNLQEKPLDGANIIPLGVGYDFAILVGRSETLKAVPNEEASYALYTARITSLNGIPANARTMFEHGQMLSDKDNRNSNIAHIKRSQIDAYSRSICTIFPKPASGAVHGKHVSLTWKQKDGSQKLCLYKLPHCADDDKLEQILPPRALLGYDLYWPFLVMACRAEEICNIDFLWALDGSERMSAFRTTNNVDRKSLEGKTFLLVIDLHSRAWLRAMSIAGIVSALSIFPRQTSWLDKDYPVNKLRIVWTTGPSLAANTSDEEPISHSTGIEYLLPQNCGVVPNDCDDIHQKEQRKLLAAAGKSASDDDGESHYPKPEPNSQKGGEAKRLWKTSEQELKEKERTGHSYTSAPDTLAVAVYQYHWNEISQWSAENVSTLIPKHLPYYAQNELYYGRECAPVDRSIIGIICVTLERDYKVRFSATRAPKANAALQTANMFDISTGLVPKDESNQSKEVGGLPAKAFGPIRQRPPMPPVGTHYKAIFTSFHRIVVQFPCGTLVFFSPMSKVQIQQTEELALRLEKIRQEEEEHKERAERRIRNALRQAGKIKEANNVGGPSMLSTSTPTPPPNTPEFMEQ